MGASTIHPMRIQFRDSGRLVAAALALLITSASVNAAFIDLGSSGSGSIAGALFSTTAVQPTGTGVFQPFLTVQSNGATEQGYNSSTNNFDTKRSPQWNHEIRLSDLQVTNIGNIGYYGFVVDINEPNGNGQSTISLDGLRIWTSSMLQHSTSTDPSGIFNGSLGNLVFDLANNSVHYDDQQHGSGSGDVNIYIPVSLFAGANPNDYVYMYQLWSGVGGGFEETSTLSGNVVIPETPAFLPIVLLLATIAVTQIIKSRRRQA